MRRHALAISLVMVAHSTAAVSSAWPQAIELASRGPRFIAGWTLPEKAVELDVSNAAVLRRRVSLDLTNVTVEQALKEITRQADLEISYSATLLPRTTGMSLHVRDITVAAALTEVLLDAGVDVALSRSGHLALVKRPLTPADRIVADTGSIRGQVTDKATGTPLQGATVVVEESHLSAVTNAEGRYSIPRVGTGTYTIRARYIGYAIGVLQVTIDAGEESIVDFGLDKSVQRLDEVVTTGTLIPTEVKALPTPITVISGEQIAARHPRTLGDVIRQAVPTAVVPEVASQPIQTPISVRGVGSLETSQMKIFVDGVEASLFAVSPVDPASIERIEVVRGPQAATIYGADASVGVIQIFTKRGAPGLTSPQVDAQGGVGLVQTPYSGFDGVLRQEYKAAVRGGTGGMSYNFGGSYTRLDDYVPEAQASRQSAPSLHGGMQFARGIITADLSARYYRNELPVVVNPLALETGFPPLSRPFYLVQDWRNETYGTRITVVPNSWWRNQFSIGVDHVVVPTAQTQPRLTTPDDTLLSVSREDHRKISLNYNSSATAQLSAEVGGSLTLGIDHYDSDASIVSAVRGSSNASADGSFTSNTVRNTGYFAQTQVNFREAFFITAGLRADENSAFGQDFGTPVSPRIGVSALQRFGQTSVKIRGSYGRAVKAPLPDFSLEAITPFSIQLANPLLGPERQRGWDGGIDLILSDQASFSMTGYSQTADNLILGIEVASDPVFTFQYQNIGRVVNRGVELEGTFTVRSVELKAHYGYVHSRIRELGPGVGPEADLRVGDQPLNTPAHTAGATLSLQARPGTLLTGGFTYTGSFRGTDVIGQFRCFAETGPCPESFLTSGSTRDFIVSYPSVTKFNVAVTQDITRQVQGFVAVDNLTNKTGFLADNFQAVLGRVTMVGLRFVSR